MSSRGDDVPDSAHKAWLATLDPDVRLYAEAEVAFYNNEDLWDWEQVEDDDWESDPNGGMGLMVDFDAEEVQLMFEAYGRSADLASMMKQMLLGRVRLELRESVKRTSETVSAEASRLADG